MMDAPRLPADDPALDMQWRRSRWRNLAILAIYTTGFLVAYGWLQAAAIDPRQFRAQQLFLSRCLLATMGLHLCATLVLEHNAWLYQWRRFFWAPSPPQHLALLRILVAGEIFVELVFQGTRDWIAFADLPHEMRRPLPLVGWLIDILPISHGFYLAALVLGIGCSFFAAMGLGTRPMLLALVPLACYLFGVPQCFGKISHSQYLVWLPAILAFTPCGRVWSLDAVVARIRGERIEKRPAFKYGLGIRWMMLTMVGIYFFSGVHKLYDIGLYWALSDNPVNLLRTEWLEQFQAVPLLRVDRWPWLCRVAALGVIAFELGYPFFLLGNRSRKILALTTISFHSLNGYFLKIDFPFLKASHLAYFDVDRMGKWLGSRPRRWFAWLILLLGASTLGWLTGAAFMILPVFILAMVNLGWRAIPLRKRVEWLLRLRKRLPLARPSSQQAAVRWIRWSMVTGLLLVSINGTLGALGISSWPFSAYPSYTFVREATVKYAWFIPEDASGSVLDLDAEAQNIGFSKENVLPLAEQIAAIPLSDSIKLREAVLHYWSRWQTAVPHLMQAIRAKVVVREYPLDPEARGNYLQQSQIGELSLKDGNWTFSQAF